MLRGDVYAARLDPVEGSEHGGARPVVVVSNDDFNAVVPVVTVVPAASYRSRSRIYPSEVLVRRGDGGLRTDSLVLAHQVRTISTSRIGRRIGRLHDDTLRAIDAALLLHLGFFES